MTVQLNPPIPVTITAKTLPHGVAAKSARGWCYAWKDCGIDGHRLWIVVLDETGEVVDVPQPEVRVDMNWSMGRRPEAEPAGKLEKWTCTFCGYAATSTSKPICSIRKDCKIQRGCP